MRLPNRYVAAFKENANVAGLATAVALSAAMLNPLPLLAGIVAEAAYLVFVPDSRWYDARLSRRYDAEVAKRRQELKDQVMPLLRPEMRERFVRLEATRGQIAAQTVENQKWFRQVLRKLDYLLEKFLVFAGKEAQFRAYLLSVRAEVTGESPRERGRSDGATLDDERPTRDRMDGPRRPAPRPQRPPDEPLPPGSAERWVAQIVRDIQAAYDREAESLRRLLEEEQDFNTKAVLEKRLEVAQRRQESVGKIGHILSNLTHQLKLLEDTFGLINDEFRARSPEQVLADIEDVVGQTESMTSVLDELAPYDQLVARLGA